MSDTEEPLVLSLVKKHCHINQHDSSIKQLSASLNRNNKLKGSKDFLPFINERDSTGKLLKNNQSQNSIFSQNKTEKKQAKSNVAFFKTEEKTQKRVTKKSNDSLPVGLYNPSFTDKRHFAVSKTERFEKTKNLSASSLDFVDLNAIYAKNKSAAKKNVVMEKQRSKNMIEEHLINEDNFLIPRVVLPEYLERFKGLYHAGMFAKSDIQPLRKDANERTMELKERLNQHIVNLRNVNSFYKKYGIKCSWKLSSDLF